MWWSAPRTCSTWCCARSARQIKPVMSLYDCRQIGSYPTTLPPMRALRRQDIKAMEGKDGMLSVSIAHCFPYADVPEIGRMLVIADDDKAKADRAGDRARRGVRVACAARPRPTISMSTAAISDGAGLQRRRRW